MLDRDGMQGVLVSSGRGGPDGPRGTRPLLDRLPPWPRRVTLALRQVLRCAVKGWKASVEERSFTFEVVYANVADYLELIF